MSVASTGYRTMVVQFIVRDYTDSPTLTQIGLEKIIKFALSVLFSPLCYLRFLGPKIFSLALGSPLVTVPI